MRADCRRSDEYVLQDEGYFRRLTGVQKRRNGAAVGARKIDALCSGWLFAMALLQLLLLLSSSSSSSVVTRTGVGKLPLGASFVHSRFQVFT